VNAALRKRVPTRVKGGLGAPSGTSLVPQIAAKVVALPRFSPSCQNPTRVEITQHIGQQQPLRKFVAAQIAPTGDSDQALDEHIRETAITVHHPCCTCRMGGDQDPNRVLDAELRVVGTSGLRVVDASGMPDLIGGNINAAVIMIAEKAADLIRKPSASQPYSSKLLDSGLS
jgi:hypothetical protein